MTRPSYDAFLKYNPKLKRYADALRNENTRANYLVAIKLLVGDRPDKFLTLVEKDRKKAEFKLLDNLVEMKNRGLSGASIRGPFYALKGFLLFYELPLNWRKFHLAIPPSKKVANDRPPAKDEIRRLLDVCDLRTKVVVHLLASSGMRIGAFDFLCVGDFKEKESGIGALTVYRGDPEQYTAFISPEAVGYLKRYLDGRRKVGEDVNDKSPLIRDLWTHQNRKDKLDPSLANRLPSKFIRKRLGEYWIKSGVRDRLQDGARQEFQQAHGFRKFFNTQANQVIQRNDVEVLMGHMTNYYKPTDDYLAKAYLKAIPHLTISEVEELRKSNEKMKSVIDELENLKARLALVESGLEKEKTSQ